MAAKSVSKSKPKAVATKQGGMRARLNKRPQFTVKVPIDKQNPDILDVTLQINGHTVQIKRGVEVKISDIEKKLLERGGYL